jgi:hypothetical protein
MRDLPEENGRGFSVIMGRVEHIDPYELYIDASSLMERYGKYFSCRVNLVDAIYNFGDWRETADERTRDVFKTTHDYFLIILLPTGGVCEILIAKPGGEVMDIILRQQR